MKADSASGFLVLDFQQLFKKTRVCISVLHRPLKQPQKYNRNRNENDLLAALNKGQYDIPTAT